MAYKALYRKYRPNNFSEVIGQKHVVETLKNAIKNDKLAHAYLFCGPRGTGKTTIAKILAKTINCKDEENRPCGKCESCLEIQQSSYPDVIEMDAASNNGVDEVRELIEKVKYAPIHGKYKVYIIDEVHMMTTSAFNALLKTLEEPPQYCIFVLATTEPHKVLPTIISRCQRFDFRKLNNEDIEANLKDICQKEEVKIEDAALKMIASLADGGMRDALSILDQCIAYKENDITLDDVSIVYGVATTAEKIELLKLVKEKNCEGMVNAIKSLSNKGIDIARLTNDMINIAKDAVVFDYCGNATVLSCIDRESAKQILELFESDILLKFIDCFIETLTKYKESTSSLTYFEVCLLKMMEIEKSQTDNQKPVVEKKNEEMKIERLDYSDEQYYQILISSNKQIKEIDNKIISNLPTSSFSPKERMLLETIKNNMIMASSEKNIIFAVSDRNTANVINDKANNEILKTILKKYLQNDKEVIAVTYEQRDYLITYFKSKQNQQKREKKEEVKEETTQQKLEKLFGENGFDVVGD
ncbi:MAG: DNA polymerase III subunit gamma/tau [Erysipelotrichaceae bacterium]